MQKTHARTSIWFVRSVLGVHSRADRAVRLRWRRLLPTLPTFLLIGAPQSGTSWLNTQLSQHPDVAMPLKELRYFDVQLYRSLRWYGSHYRGLEARAARGEKSPNYYRLTPESIRVIRNLMPDVRLLLIARDPVERAWSAYRRMRPDRESATVENVARLLTGAKSATHHQGLDPASENGRYAPAVANWLRSFPREQLLAVPFDRIVSDPRGLVYDVLVHVGVDPMRYPWELLSEEKRNANPPERMPDDVRTYLCRYFAGERDALATLLQCDPLWRDELSLVEPS